MPRSGYHLRPGTNDAIAQRCAKAFLVIGLPALLLLCFLVPPFQGSDEPAHYLRVLAVRNGQVFPKVVRHDPTQLGGPSAGGDVDAAAADMALGISPTPYHHYTVDEVKAEAQVPAAGRRDYARHSNTAIYSPITYLPASIAVGIAQAFGLPVLWWLYAGRVAGALFAVAILRWAIGRSGDAALAFLVAATLPIVLFQAAVLTTDAMLLPGLLLFGAMLRRIATKAPMTAIEHAATVLTMIVIALAKVAYLPIVVLPALAALLADRRWSLRARRYALATMIAVLLWLGWAWAVHDKVFQLYANTDVDTPRQFALLRHAPGYVLDVILRTMQRDLPSMTFGMTGSQLGRNDLLLPKPFIVLALVALVVAALPARQPVKTGVVLPALTLLVIAACYLAIYLLLYLQFNAVGSATVEGVQARYLTPLALVILSVTPRLRLGERGMARATTVAIAWSAVSVAVTLGGTLLNYWKL